jgi:hypothetical protein
MEVANTLAYYDKAKITAIKSFIVQATDRKSTSSGVCDCDEEKKSFLKIFSRIFRFTVSSVTGTSSSTLTGGEFRTPTETCSW